MLDHRHFCKPIIEQRKVEFVQKSSFAGNIFSCSDDNEKPCIRIYKITYVG